MFSAINKVLFMAKNKSPIAVAQSGQITYQLIHDVSCICDQKINKSLYHDILER
jgi:hypothetical protein